MDHAITYRGARSPSRTGHRGRTGEDGIGIRTRQPIEGGRGVSAGCELHFETPRVSTFGRSITQTALPEAPNTEGVQFWILAEYRDVAR